MSRAAEQRDEYVGKLNKLDSEHQHLKHEYEGYRAYTRGEEPNCPYSPGSARAVSWQEGYLLACADETNRRHQ